MRTLNQAFGLAALLVLLACPGMALAAPGNDDPPDATELTLTGTQGEFDSISTGDATTYDGEPMTASDPTNGRCQANGTQVQDPTAAGSQMTKTAWWTFVGNGGRATVSSYFSNFDTVLAVWTFGNDDLFHFVKCNDDVDLTLPDLTSELFFNTAAGQRYYVQVGGCDGCSFGGDPTPDSGSLGVYVYPSPPNDTRSKAQTAPLGQNMPRDTLGAQSDGDAITRCGAHPFGKTVWYRFSIPRTGTATVDASGFDSVVALYAGSSTAPFACGFSPPDGATSITRRLGPGTYFAQVGGQGPGISAARGDLNFKVNFVADRDPVIITPPPVITPPVVITPPPVVRGIGATYDYDGVWGGTSKFTTLDVVKVPKGAKITVTCKGKGCKRKRFVKNVRRATKKVKLAKSMRRNSRLRPGAVVEVRVTAPNRIGRVFRFKIRSFDRPARKTLCLKPGAKKARSC